jgi:hypothetical protein
MTTDRIEAYKRDGYTVFRNVFTPEQLAGWRAAYDALSAREGEPVWFGGALETDPELFLPAATAPEVLDFLESVMGPFVQLEDLSINAFPSKDAAAVAGTVNAWHRDRYAVVPETTDYLRPISCNTIWYLQNIDPAFGPLRVVPGSHRAPIAITAEDRQRPRPDEVLLYPQAGDVVVTHYLLMHSGTPNTSGALRYFMAASFNSSWMRTRNDFDGPRVSALKDRLRAAGDRRTLRLLGEDPLVWDRVNPYWFTGTEEERWAAWIAEDRAAEAGTAAAANRFVHRAPEARTVTA